MIEIFICIVTYCKNQIEFILLTKYYGQHICGRIITNFIDMI